MDLSLDESQRLFERATREFFRREWSVARTRELAQGAFATDIWARLGTLGWLRPRIGEADGAGVVELQLLAEAMGEVLFASPLLESVAMAAWLIGTAGTAPQRAALLEPLATGTLVATVASCDVEGGWATGAEDTVRDGSSRVLHVSGSRSLVGFAEHASYAIWPSRFARDHDSTLLLIDLRAPGVSRTYQPNIAGQPLHVVTLDDVRISIDAMLGRRGGGPALLEAALARASVVQCGQLTGAARRIRDMTLAYARERHQFGRPIGAFQLVQSLCVDIAADAHRMALLGRQAAWLIDSGRPCTRETHMAAAFAARAIARVARNAHEVHAGLGFMSDHDLQLFTRHAKHWETRFGDAAYHLDRIARIVAEERT